MPRLLSISDFRAKYRTLEQGAVMDSLIGTQLDLVTHELEAPLRTRFGREEDSAHLFYWDGRNPPYPTAHLILNPSAAFLDPTVTPVVKYGSTPDALATAEPLLPANITVKSAEGLLYLFNNAYRPGYYQAVFTYGFLLPESSTPPEPEPEPVYLDVPDWLKEVAAAWAYQLVVSFVDPAQASKVLTDRVQRLVSDHARSYPLALKPLVSL